LPLLPVHRLPPAPAGNRAVIRLQGPEPAVAAGTAGGEAGDAL
jgi:hypothetical protein